MKNKIDASYSTEFSYTHKNPYHDKLNKYSSFVLRDLEAEQFQEKWCNDIFNNEAPLNVEIGSGYGTFMREFLVNHPNENFVGMDYRFKRTFQLAEKLSTLDSKNYRYLRAKGERLSFIFGKQEIDKLFYFFPDPWPKTRHKKKRLFNDHFLKIVHPLIRKTGKILIKTDHDDYAKQMLDVINNSPLFEIEMMTFDLRTEFPDHFLAKYITKFEKIFISQSIPIKAFVIKPLHNNGDKQ